MTSLMVLYIDSEFVFVVPQHINSMNQSIKTI